MWCYLAVSANRDLQSSGCIEALLLGVYNLVCISTFCFGIKMNWLFQWQLFKSMSEIYNMNFHSLVNIFSALYVVLEYFVTYFLVLNSYFLAITISWWLNHIKSWWLNSHSAWELFEALLLKLLPVFWLSGLKPQKKLLSTHPWLLNSLLSFEKLKVSILK